MIDKVTEERIKGAAKIADVLTDQGVVLRAHGHDLIGLCPFHEDRTAGSFVVSTLKNICSCYSCGAVGIGPVDALIRLKYGHMDERKAYPEALRYLAAMYNIFVDEQDPPKVEKKAPLTPPPPKLDTIMWTGDIVRPFRQFEAKNTLLAYLRSLPLTTQDRERLEKAIRNYAVGTYPKPPYEGWTMWWYIDQLGQVRSAKMMCYKPDGHRDKTQRSTWAHSLMARWRIKNGKEYEAERWRYDNHTHQPDLRCFFGQHLLEMAKDAVIRLVESEKTAIICSAFTNPKEVLWMATGGMQNLQEDRLLTILKKGRTIELYPDYDGYAQWEEKIDRPALKPYIDKGRLRISPMVKTLHTEADGEKADIADIMIRIVTFGRETAEHQYQPTADGGESAEHQYQPTADGGTAAKESPLHKEGDAVEEMRERYPAVGELIDLLKLEKDQ